MWWFFVGLLLGENPVSRFGEITSGGTDCDGVALAAFDALVEVSDVLLPPVGMMVLTNDDIGGFDKDPFQVVVALLYQASVVGTARAGFDLGHEPGVAGEVLGRWESIDRADFAIDDNGEHFSRTGYSLDELHGGSALDLCQDACLKMINVFLNGVEQIELLLGTECGLGR